MEVIYRCPGYSGPDSCYGLWLRLWPFGWLNLSRKSSCWGRYLSNVDLHALRDIA